MGIVDSFKETVAFFEAIREEGFIVDYALIGGLALSAWVRPRTTRDVDLIVAISEQTAWNELAAVIETKLHKKVALQKGTQRTNIKEKLSFVAGQIEVDVIGAKGFDLASEAIRHAVSAKVFDMKVKVVTPEYLILLKLLPLSDQDIVDIKTLLKKADIKRLIPLAQRHFLLPKLERVMSEKKKAIRKQGPSR